MGALTSSLLAEILLQYMEHKKIYNILHKIHMIGYHRYVDILIIYNINNTRIAFTRKLGAE
jgi:hypothetical protein